MADAGKVLFHLTDDALIVANSGKAFTRKGVIAVCYSCISPKSNNLPEDTYKENGADCSDARLPALIRREMDETAANARKALMGMEAQTAEDYAGRFELELLQNADDAVGDRANSELIGAKGKGFKSVLEITDRPQISSGGFNFLLEISPEDGLRVPACSPVIKSPLFPDAATVVRLGFRDDEAKKVAMRDLAKIRPEMLLFCQRLSHVEIHIDGESPRFLALEREGSFGFDSEKKVFTLKENGVVQKWIRWSAAWTAESADSADSGKRLSAALCLPADKDGKAVSLEKERPMHVFFPTSEELPGLMALMHASYRLGSNRKHLLETDKQPDSPAIREKFRGLTADILKDIPASAALRAFGKISASKGSAATNEIKQLQNVFSSAVAQTPFVPVVGGVKVRPAEARIWRHRLGEVLRENNRGVREAKLLAPSLSAESDVHILKNLGAERVSPHGHAELLRACRNDTLPECHEAWKVAGDIMSEVSKIPSEQKKVVIYALKDAPIWWTDAGTPRSLNGDIPLLQERPKPKNWPDWLKADALSSEFRKLLTDKARHKTDNPLTRHDSLKDAAVWPLHTPHSYFTGALLPFCEGKNSEWWEKMGWDVLQWAIRWGGDKTGESIIHLPTDKGWLPAFQCYAGKDWDGPASFDKYFQSVRDRGVILPIEKWNLPSGAESDKKKWGKFLCRLGVSWETKVFIRDFVEFEGSPPRLFEEYKEECLRYAQRMHRSACMITGGKCAFIEHFPESLLKCSPAQVLRVARDVNQLAKEQGRITYSYLQGDKEIPVQSSFASFQLRQSEWVPCRSGLSDYVGKRKTVAVRPGDAFMPECELDVGGIVPVVRKPDAFPPDEWGAVYGVLKELGVSANVPASEDKEWWSAQMSKLAEIAKGLGEENEELRHGRDSHGGMSIVILRLYGAYGNSLANMGDVPHLVKTDNGEFIHFGPFKDVYWADMHYHGDADVRRNLLDKGFKLFPFFLRKGERFGVKPLSGFIDESPEENESQRETEEIRRRFERRREMLALATGKPKDHFNFGDKIRGNSALALILTRKDDGIEIARPEVDFYMVGEDKLLINAGGNKWRALAAGVAAWCKLPETAAPVFEGLLCETEDERGDDECRKRLRQLGISDSDIPLPVPPVPEGNSGFNNNGSPIPGDKGEHPPDGESQTGGILNKENTGNQRSDTKSENNRTDSGKGSSNNVNRGGGGDPVIRKEVEFAAMNAVKTYYRGKGYDVVDVAADNLGWDLEVFRRGESDESGEKIWNVEVKGTSDNKISVILTPNEYDKSDDEMYRLAVVRNALDGDARACAIYKREGDEWRLKGESDKDAPKRLVMEKSATVREPRTR